MIVRLENFFDIRFFGNFEAAEDDISYFTGKSDLSKSLVLRASKRFFDIFFVILAMPLVILAMLICVPLIKWNSAGPVIYTQKRVGKNGREFSCLKLRTMVMGADRRLEEFLNSDPTAYLEYERTRKLRDDPRVVPKVGEFLRRTSLDEVPQFFNVLVGHMSIVGPRPVPADELELYGARRDHYLEVRPGITGFWQVCGRSDTSYERRVLMDAYYVRNMNMGTDLAIIAKTVGVVLSGQGAY